MRLQRQEGGVVLLEDTPVKEWFERNNISPAQDRYRGDGGGGRCAMCILTTLAYVKLGYDADALHARMNAQGVGSGYRRVEAILADLIGIDYRDAQLLESGWTGDKDVLAVAKARGLPTVLWDLGRDAWEQAREARFGHEGPRGALGAGASDRTIIGPGRSGPGPGLD
jgi:hypothetical protein